MYIGYHAHALGNGEGWVWGLNQSLPRIHSSMLPAQKAFNRKLPGAPNKMDTLLRRIAASELVFRSSTTFCFPRECGNKSLY